jgi:chromosomal replication initiator protein
MERQLDLTAQSLWREVAARLKQALNETTYQTWFGEARGIELSSDTFTIAAPNDFAKAWIGGHFLELIKAAVREATGKELLLRLRERGIKRELERSDDLERTRELQIALAKIREAVGSLS